MKPGFTVRRGGPLRRESQADPAGDAFGYVESVINECARALPMIEAGDYAGAVANLERASTFLSKGMDILKHIGEVPLYFRGSTPSRRHGDPRTDMKTPGTDGFDATWR